MSETASWDEIALGGCSAGEAQAVIRSAVDRLTTERARQMYEALRAWTWKALNHRRRDKDLCEWHEVLRATDAILSREHPEIAARVATLSELIYESIAVSETFASVDALARPYVQDVLIYLSRSGPATDDAISARTGLALASVRLILNLMSNCDLTGCQWNDSVRHHVLTNFGRRAALEVKRKKVSPLTPKARELRKRASSPLPLTVDNARRDAGLSKEPVHEDRGRPSQNGNRHDAGLHRLEKAYA